MYDSAARAPRGGRERRVGLRKPAVVRRDRRPAYRHSGGRLDGPIGFPKAHPSLPPGERAVRVRTETLPSWYVACYLRVAGRCEVSTILIIILVLLLIGALPTWPYSSGWGYYPSGGVGLIVLILVVLLLTGRL